MARIVEVAVEAARGRRDQRRDRVPVAPLVVVGRFVRRERIEQRLPRRIHGSGMIPEWPTSCVRERS